MATAGLIDSGSSFIEGAISMNSIELPADRLIFNFTQDVGSISFDLYKLELGKRFGLQENLDSVESDHVGFAQPSGNAEVADPDETAMMFAGLSATGLWLVSRRR